MHRAALIAAVMGAVGSTGFMLYAGRHNNSRLLLFIFAIWVVSPFMAVLGAHAISKGWSVLTRRALDVLTLFLMLVSLTIYGYVALGPPRGKTAPVFVVVPPASWLLIAAACLYRRGPDRS